MEHILKYFPELDEAFKKSGRRVQIRVFPSGHHALGKGSCKIDLDRDDKGSIVDIRIDIGKVADLTFQALETDESDKKLVLGVRYKGKLTGTFFFDRNNQGKPVSKPGIFTLADYEKSLIPGYKLKRKYDSGDIKLPEEGLNARVIKSFTEMGMICSSGLRFSVGRDNSVNVDFSRISNILDENGSKRQILLKGRGEVNYLCGMDERLPFIAGVTREANTVKEAHKMLQPAKLTNKDKCIRQGEWFFIKKNVPVNLDKKNILKEFELKRNRRSKPHIVEMALKKSSRIYAKGWVEHEDHSAVFLDGWHLVEANREIVDKQLFYQD
jgi:hypothetical protein